MKMINFKLFSVATTLTTLYISHCSGIVNLQEYCNAFDSNFKPIICVLKQQLSTQTQSSQNIQEETNNVNSNNRLHHRNPDYWQEDSEDEDCCCDLWCFPDSPNNSTIPLNISSVVASSYNCRSCGTECWISSGTTQRNSICSCAVLGSSLMNTTCTCTALCATFRHEESSEANCIFNVNGLMDMRLLDERRPYTCECRKSKAAEFNSNPFFVCICQRAN